MTGYTDEQLQQLRDQWKKHEADLKKLIPDIRDNPEWEELVKYMTLMDSIEGIVGVNCRRKAEENFGRKACLAGADLHTEDLSGADLSCTDLEGANLSGANLREAHLSHANLKRTDLSPHLLPDPEQDKDEWVLIRKHADLSGADLCGADLSGANLWGADLSGSDLKRANLSNTRSWIGVKWNAKNKLGLKLKRLVKYKKIDLSERKTAFGDNDVRNADWRGVALLKRYVEDENFLYEYEQTSFPWWRRVLRWLWKWTCDYGRSFKRWSWWSAFLAMVFAVIYWKVFGCNSIAFNVAKLGVDQPGFRGYLYYSVVTFTTLGFGDIVPLTNWARLVVGLEVIAGYIMLGGLISIFANKLARRA